MNADEVRSRDYVFGVARLLSEKLNGAPAFLLEVDALNELQNHLQPALDQLHQFVKSKEGGHVRDASTHMRQSLKVSAWALPVNQNPKHTTAIENAIKAISQAADAAIASLSAERDKLAESIDDLRGQAQRQAEQIEQTSQKIAELMASMQSAISEINSKYSQLEIDFKKRFDEELGEIDKDYSDLRKKLSDQADETLSILSNHETDAKRIVQIVGNIGVTGNFQKVAGEQSAQANLWRWITLLLFGSGILLVSVTLGVQLYREATQPNFETDIFSLVARLAIGVAVALPALYTARESARHRTTADRAKQTELELASLGPFMEQLPEETKVELRRALTERYFGRNPEPHIVQDPVDLDKAKSLIQEITSLISRIRS